MFVINCKNYEEIAGDKIIRFIKSAEKMSKKYKVKISNITTTAFNRTSIK